MNTIKGVVRRVGIITALAGSLAAPLKTLAIEGLQLSLQCSNVVLSWPSTPGQNYIIQYRPTLDPSTPWQTLTDSYPADWTTSITVFVHSNIVQNPNCGGIGGGSLVAMSPMKAQADSGVATTFSVPMVKHADGSGPVLPLAIYPPGIDLSRFIIFDPSTGEWMSGAGYTTAPLSADSLTADGPVPLDDNGGTSNPPDMAFYQVVQVGVRILNSCLSTLTNGPVSNTITLSFEAGNPVGTLQEAYVLVDGVAYRGSGVIFGPPTYPASLTVDTSYLENGDHTFQVEAGWINPDIDDLDNAMFHWTSDPVTLTVSNSIYYPEWEDEIGELGFSAYFAKTTCTNADWRIDIYDVNTNFVQSLTGHTDDGIIEAYWNMVDTNGVVRTNTDVDTEFNSIITVADPITKALPKKKPAVNYPTHGQWVIAYQDTFGYVASSNNYYQAVYDFGGMANEFGGAVTYFPSSPTNGQTFPLRRPYTNPIVNVSMPTILLDIHALEALLKRPASRNFYYNGHGAAQGIAEYLSSYKIQQDVKGHPYRFVFLDACSTTKGALAAAFGNSATAMQPLSYYQKHGIRPRAFLGYDHDVHYLERGSFYDPTTGQNYSKRVKEEVYEFLDNFEFFWYYGYFGRDLASALYNAYAYTPSLPYGVWQNGDGLRLFGYSELGIDDYNVQSDWSN